MFVEQAVTPHLALTMLTPAMALVGIACVLIPIIIHLLFRRRKRPVHWATMRFIIEAWQAKRRRILLERNILLLIRCCIPLLLGIALAEPLITSGSPWSNVKHSCFIVIDDSPVTSTESSSGEQEINFIKKNALDIVSNLDSDTDIFITTTSHEGLTLCNKEEATRLINTITPSSIPADLINTLQSIQTTIEESNSNTIYIVSPFRTGSISTLSTDTHIEWPEGTQLLFTPPTTQVVENTRIQSVEPLRRFKLRESPWSVSENRTITHLVRDGSALPPTTTTISTSTGKQTSSTEISWEQGQVEQYVYTRIPNQQDSESPIITRLIHQDALEFDDVYYSKSNTIESIRILSITDRSTNNQPDWLELSLNPTRNSSINIQNIHPAAVQSSDFNNVSVVLITTPQLLDTDSNRLLVEYFNQGGLIIITPPGSENSTDWATLLSEDIGIDWEFGSFVTNLNPSQHMNTNRCSSSILKMILDEIPDLLETTQIYKRLDLNIQNDQDIILRCVDGTPAISTHESPNSSGRVILFSFTIDPSWTNLPTQPLIVPLVQELVWGSLGSIHHSNGAYTGQSVSRLANDVKYMSLADTRVLFDPETHTTIDVIKQPGAWVIQSATPEIIPININPVVLSTTHTTTPIITKLLGVGWTPVESLSARSKTTGDFRFLIPILVILLVLLLSETILARIFSHPTRSTQTQGEPV